MGKMRGKNGKLTFAAVDFPSFFALIVLAVIASLIILFLMLFQPINNPLFCVLKLNKPDE
ncbi:hypothetical protein ERHA54_24350 [Erwinia rhapontici]|nr:hypothetical protein ERHA54_24350 [Erwinia rhapontici]